MTISESYRKKLARRPGGSMASATEGSSDLESVSFPDETSGGEDMQDRAEQSREELYRIIDLHLGKDKKLYEIADRVAREGKDALRAVSNGDDRYLEQNPEKTSLLEVIVRTDGSRPSFMIRNGKVDKTTSPVGSWSDWLDLSEDLLKNTLACVGRIDRNGSHVGTGFLVKENLIVTNRHVLQAIAINNVDGSWQMRPGTTIDFGYEFRAVQTFNRRALKKLVFCGNKPIDPFVIDHSKLDLALIEIETTGEEMPVPLSLNIAPEWAVPGSVVYTIGYPAHPGTEGLRLYTNLLEELFKSTFGYKRLAPGEVMESTYNAQQWGVAHDATTLGGNSGSVIVVTGKEYAAAGLHYGGALRAPRENWGHILANTLDTTNGTPGKKLRDYLQEYGVRFVDIING